MAYTKKELVLPAMYHSWFEYNETNPFEYGTTEYSSVNACWLAEASRIAYLKSRTRVKEEFERVGFKIEFFDNEGTQCFVATSDKAMIVAFRGTEPKELNDLKADLKFLREKSETVGKVHRGFKDALDYVWVTLSDYIEQNREGKTVWLTGHSLGAALATITASRIESNGLYTYGSPRVGNKVFAEFVKSKQPTFRFVNNNDIVPKVPPFFFFRHTNKMIYLSSDGKVYRDSLWWRMFVDGIKGNIVSSSLSFMGLKHVAIAVDLLDGIHDHNIINYCRILKGENK